MCCGDLGCAPVGGACCASWYCYPGYSCCEGPEYCCPTDSSTSTPAPAPAPADSYSAGGCIFEGVTVSGNVDCNGNSNTQNVAGTVRVNHALLVSCIAIVALFLMVKGDENAGGCVVNGGDQSGIVDCSGNTNNVNEEPGVASSLNVDLRFLAVLCIILNLFNFVGADTVGGCIVNGGTVQNLNCSGNTQNTINNSTSAQATPSSSGSSDGLSPGALAGIALASVSVAIALLTLFASIVNNDAVVGTNRTPIRRFKRAPVYRIIEGCTLLFGCGTLGALERAMGRFVERGGQWHSWEDVPPAYPGPVSPYSKA